MSKKSKMPNLKEETSEDMSKYNVKSKKKSSEISKSVLRQAKALDNDEPVGRSTAIMDTVMSQARNLDSGNAIGKGAKSQSPPFILDSVMSQAVDLDSGNAIGKARRMDKKSSAPKPPPVPPPAAPPNVQAYLAHAPLIKAKQVRFKISAQDLELERKKLKKPYEIKKQVNLERADFYDTHQIYTHIPLLEARESLRMSTLRSEVISISFDGIEQLSDAFLFSLHHCKLNLSTVKWISLSGCYNVTDEGVYWISLVFPNLRSIQLSGCYKVTEKSFGYLRKLSMTNMILDGTSCGVLPLDVNLGQNFKTNPNAPSVTLNGCPLMSPLLSEINREAEYKSWSPGNFPATQRKLVILTPEDLPWNPLAVLTNGQDISAKPGLLFKQNWTPFKDNKITGVKSTAETFNVFQVTRGMGLTELVVSPGSIVVIPYHLHKDMPKSPAADLAYTVISVLSKYDDCSFVLLGMSDSKDSTDYEKTVQKMFENVNKYFRKWIDRLEGSIRMAIHSTNWRMAAFNFQDQENLAHGQKLLRIMNDLLNLTTSSVKVGEKLASSDLKFLVEIVELDEKNYPWNRQPMMSNKILEYSAQLKKACIKLNTVSELQNTCKFIGLSPRTYTNNMAKLASYSALWGNCLYFPELDMGPVITDYQFLADTIQKLMFTSAPQTCDIRCLGDKIPCWKKQDLMKVWSGASEDQIMRVPQMVSHGRY